MKNKPLSILFSIIVAFTLWLYVITVISPESTAEFPNVAVQLDGESILLERGLMLISDTTPTAKVTLNGNRSDLININSGNLTLIADLTKITEPGVHSLTYTVNPPGDMAVSVENREPKTVSVTVAERISNPVPVVIEYTGTLPEGFIMDKGNELLSTDTVTVAGPREVVEQIDHALVTVSCDDRTESFVENLVYTLCDGEGNPLDVSLITTDVKEIRLEVRVSRFKIIPLTLKVTAGGGATEDTTRIDVDPLQIIVSGSDTALENLTELVLGTVNLADITEDTQKEYTITLPEGIKNESGVETALVTVSFPELRKKDFTITNIRTINVTEGMEAQLMTQKLTVTVRGPSEQVDRLRAEDISVVLDLQGVVNADTVVPTITFGDSFPDLGVVGKPTVSVTVAVPATEPTEG